MHVCVYTNKTASQVELQAAAVALLRSACGDERCFWVRIQEHLVPRLSHLATLGITEPLLLSPARAPARSPGHTGRE